MSHYTNLKAVFHLNTDMVIPLNPIPFEALLMKAFAVMKGYSLDKDPNLFTSPELPLERNLGFSSLYMASIGFIVSAGRNVHFFTKRYHGNIPNNLDISGGFFKAYHNPVFTLSCPITVTFYCKGEKEAIEELLSYIPALGPKRSQGYGKVSKVIIEEIEEDRSWIYKDQPMRAIPIQYDKAKITEWYYAPTNPTPPSYTSYQMELCYLPRISDWLSFLSQPHHSHELEDQLLKPNKMKKTKGFRKVWDELDTI